MPASEKIIKLFKMKPLPQEGGFYTETYRSPVKMRSKAGVRNISTAILYLLTNQTISKMHKLKHDEVFHFYFGDPVTMLVLYPDGKSETITLGHNIFKGQSVQVTIPRNTWQGCFIKAGGEFALLGTTVAPGFDFSDFEMADKKTLLKKFPSQKRLIEKLT